ncbi:MULTISPECIES: BrnT family toxin [unclassified Adlercreutzia]|uniref:BrnT family toxin n=1 Tax=unclassified Adlercreutzia TaxID=2636013 RepID=UPI0013E9D7CA|nr:MULTISPECIES: BrnT family toxin [unclassified Adlercreutzia]
MIKYAFITFEWDDAKAESNQKKHGVSFTEASTVFYDPYAIVVDDEPHSYDEERFIIVGVSAVAHVLTVCHCYRQTNEVIRIISARKATKNEENSYWRYRNES